MIRWMVRKLSEQPAAFDGLRWILEGGYTGHQSVFRQELSGPIDKILDLGCGTGIYSCFFGTDAYVGADCSSEYLRAATRTFPGYQFILADAAQLPFADASIPVCMMSGVLHHLPDDTVHRALSEVSRILHPNGRFVVWEDIASAWWNLSGHIIHALDAGRHIRTSEEYRQLLAQHLEISSDRRIRSGIMDYVVFSCTHRTPA